MKRIANNVALQTILYVMPGNVKVHIIDMKENDIRWNMETAEPVWEFNGEIIGLSYGYKTTKIRNAKVRHIDNEGDMIRIYISTEFEEY